MDLVGSNAGDLDGAASGGVGLDHFRSLGALHTDADAVGVGLAAQIDFLKSDGETGLAGEIRGAGNLVGVRGEAQESGSDRFAGRMTGSGRGKGAVKADLGGSWRLPENLARSPTDPAGSGRMGAGGSGHHGPDDLKDGESHAWSAFSSY